MKPEDIQRILDNIHNVIRQNKDIEEEISNIIKACGQSTKHELLQYIQKIIDALDEDPLLDKKNKDLCKCLFAVWKVCILKYFPNTAFITPKDIYNSLWRCRDFELSHLWQRSIFLTAFLVMCFTGYGGILLKICEYTTEEKFCTVFCILNIAGLFIALLGFILSALWIMMGKGSKAWYEKYESAIYKIERNPKYSEKIVVNDMDEEELMHGSLPAPIPLDTSLFTTNAGKFSVSRINIAIGQVSMSIWILIYFIHTLLFSFSNQLACTIGCDSYGITIMSIIICLSFGVMACFIVKCTSWCKSSGI